MSKKDNVIQFPKNRIKNPVKNRDPISERIMHELTIHEECIDLARFCIDLINNSDKDIVLIATGTGIAPFRSMVFSYPDLNFRIIHGIQRSSETYFKNEFSCNYVSCISQESSGDYSGRVTGYLKEVDFNKNSIFYLCGNFDMIYDVQNILSSKGHSLNSIFTEVYF